MGSGPKFRLLHLALTIWHPLPTPTHMARHRLAALDGDGATVRAIFNSLQWDKTAEADRTVSVSRRPLKLLRG